MEKPTQPNRIRACMLWLILVSSIVPQIQAQQIVGNTIRFQLNRGKNDCIGRNSAYAWKFYIDNEERESFDFGGSENVWVEIPLKDKDFGKQVSLIGEVTETKCTGGTRGPFVRISKSIYLPAKFPAPTAKPSLAKGVYKLKLADNGSVVRIQSVNGEYLQTSNTSASPGRIVFELTENEGEFHIRLESQNNSYLTVHSTKIGISNYPYGNRSIFGIDEENDGTFSIRFGLAYFQQNAAKTGIKLGTLGDKSSRAKFYFREVPRSVKFLATGDPQLENGNMAWDDNEFIVTNAVLDKFNDYPYGVSEAGFRGVIITGDLSQNTRKDELQKYKKLTEGYAGYLFDGLGNHDMEGSRHCGVWNISGPGGGYAVCPEKYREYIQRSRSHRIVERQGINYSWNWDDVHFVQLNLYPGNAPNYVHDGGTGNLDPQNSLSFLENDLEKHVGASGRPVVLVHHYGFDDFSTQLNNPNRSEENWWTEEERNAYWDMINSYNIAAIITGHYHNPGSGRGSSSWQPNFSKPLGKKGPAKIRSFVAGGTNATCSKLVLDSGRWIRVGVDCNADFDSDSDLEGGYYLNFAIEGDELTVNRYRASIDVSDPDRFKFNERFDLDDNTTIDYIIPFKGNNMDGRLLRASGGRKVYQIVEGKRRYVPNPETLTALGYAWRDVLKNVPTDSLDNFTLGNPLPSRKDGALLRGNGHAVYVMEGGKRHWVSSLASFNRRGYNWNDVSTIAQADLLAIPQGNNFD